MLKAAYSLRGITVEDGDLILEWRNSEHVRSYMFNDEIITAEEHQCWLQNLLQHTPKHYRILCKHQQPMGLICATQVDFKNKKCYWGFYIGATAAPAGTGRIMEFFALEYFFEQLQIRKLCGEVFVNNSRALHLHKKFGFVEEGRLVQHIKKNGIYEDVITIALFNHTWLENKAVLEKTIFGER